MTEKPKEPRTITRRTIRVKPNRYQPSKAELEQPVVIRKADGTMLTPEELARVALAPGRLVEDQEA